MDCRDVKQLLPAYSTDDISSAEKSDIEMHLAACSSCSSALEELRRTIAHVRNLEQVEPPPWLTQKTMECIRSDVREQRQSFFERIFGSWGGRVPVGAIATVLIAVCSFFVYRAIQPDIDFEEKKESAAPASVQRETAEPAGKSKEGMPTDARERIQEAPRLERPKTLVKKNVPPDKRESAPAVQAPYAATAADRERTVSQARSGKSDAAGRFEVNSAAQAQGANFERKEKKAAAPARAALAGRESVLIVRAADTANAVEKVRAAIARTGGVMVEQQQSGAATVITAEIPTVRIKDFIGDLQQIGLSEDNVPVSEAERIRLTIRVERIP
ncbi:MAG TPA: zf-HC2 domain-containing protein [Dissulfurispiraceae bacterium]|nr:zf-HC2 domain-containing protein [Dissulfurispiraceae bacterium]